MAVNLSRGLSGDMTGLAKLDEEGKEEEEVEGGMAVEEDGE